MNDKRFFYRKGIIFDNTMDKQDWGISINDVGSGLDIVDLLNTQECIIQDLEKRNKLLKNFLTILTDMMMARDWKALEDTVDRWEESERVLQEWRDGGD